jgi:endogenous inhibitor of DNA gyrase (YacG/DUF329 family)
MKANCLQCGREFEINEKKKNHRFCSAGCRSKHWNFQNAGLRVISEMQQNIKVLQGRVGAIEEIVKSK